MPDEYSSSAPTSATLPDPLSSDDDDAGQVAAALADAAHAGGLSDAYYRKADDALRRLYARLVEAERSHRKVTEDALASFDRAWPKAGQS